MNARATCFAWIALGILGCVCSAPASAGENAPEAWNKAGARAYLDTRGTEWFKFSSARRGQGASETSCISCHTLLPFALARPVLRRISDEKAATDLETKVLDQVKTRVSNWEKLDTEPFQLFYDFEDAKKTQSRGTEAILNALVLSLDDRFHGLRKPSPDAEKSLSILWATQVADGQHKGSWEWLNFGLEPWESEGGRYLGAALAAIAVGTARENGYAPAEGDSKERLASLREYLKKNHASQNLHNRAWTLWAAAKMDGLLTPQQKDQVVAQLLAKQQPGGGWSLGALGDFAQGREIRHQGIRRVCDGVGPARVASCGRSEGEAGGKQRPGVAAHQPGPDGRLARRVGQQEPIARVDGPRQSEYRQVHVGRGHGLFGAGPQSLNRGSAAQVLRRASGRRTVELRWLVLRPVREVRSTNSEIALAAPPPSALFPPPSERFVKKCCWITPISTSNAVRNSKDELALRPDLSRSQNVAGCRRKRALRLSFRLNSASRRGNNKSAQGSKRPGSCGAHIARHVPPMIICATRATLFKRI